MKRSGAARSVRALADAVGRSHTVVQRWLQRPDWPLSRTPPWDVAVVRDWAANLRPNPADGAREELAEPSAGGALEALRRNPLGAAKLKLTLTRAQKLELERAILAAEFVSRRAVEEGLLRRVHAVRGALQALPRQLAAQLSALTDENEIEQVLERALDAALLELSSQAALPPIPVTGGTE